jgi:hypothetical protein
MTVGPLTHPPWEVLRVDDSPGNVRLLQEAFRDARSTAHLCITSDGSAAPVDVGGCYELHGNCYLSKPSQLGAFEALIRMVSDFWLTAAQLPRPVERQPT